MQIKPKLIKIVLAILLICILLSFCVGCKNNENINYSDTQKISADMKYYDVIKILGNKFTSYSSSYYPISCDWTLKDGRNFNIKFVVTGCQSLPEAKDKWLNEKNADQDEKDFIKWLYSNLVAEKGTINGNTSLDSETVFIKMTKTIEKEKIEKINMGLSVYEVDKLLESNHSKYKYPRKNSFEKQYPVTYVWRIDENSNLAISFRVDGCQTMYETKTKYQNEADETEYSDWCYQNFKSYSAQILDNKNELIETLFHDPNGVQIHIEDTKQEYDSTKIIVISAVALLMILTIIVLSILIIRKKVNHKN